MDSGGTFTLAATGDLMLTEPPADPEQIRALFAGAELVLTNLELALTDRGLPADKLVNLRASPRLAHELPKLGIHVASLANNHAFDFGVEGMWDTLGALADAGVHACGVGDTDEVAFEPALIEVGGLWVAVLSFACTVPTGAAAGPNRPGLAAIRVVNEVVVDPTIFEEQPGTSPYVRTRAVEAEVERAVAAVRRARGVADFVVVALHWGVPYGWAAPFQGLLADYQRPLGHRLIEAGAGLIVGNHAHMPLGIELHGGAPIVYSVGNFMFHLFGGGGGMPVMRPAPPYDVSVFRSPESGQFESFVLLAEVSRRGVEALALHPILLDDRGEPISAPAEAARAILERVRRRSPDPGILAVDGAVGRIAVAR